MNETFVTEAIRDDRCLKAHRLLDRLETELRAEVERLGKGIVRENSHLFPAEVSPSTRISWDNGTIIANARSNFRMERVNEDEPSKSQKLNVSLRWVDPVEWDERNVEGTLCAACYKINNGNRADFDRVKRGTLEEEWEISFGEDQFNNAPGLMYIPVESGEELRDANETLRDHFGAFGEDWGVERSSAGPDNREA